MPNAFWWSFLIALTTISTAFAVDCIPTICSSNKDNQNVKSGGAPDNSSESIQSFNEVTKATYLICEEDSAIYAPFDGTLQFWRLSQGNEFEFGVRIVGNGRWQGYEASIDPILLDFYGGSVKKGQRIGASVDARQYMKPNMKDKFSEPVIRFMLSKQNLLIDSYHHLKNCMCTGQICETNLHNKLFGKFTLSEQFGEAFGWHLNCSDAYVDQEAHAPKVYSPIDAENVRRLRIYENPDGYYGCDNHGVVLTGINDWTDFEVRLYNVFPNGDFQDRPVRRGELVGVRRLCENGPDTIFIEVRYRGQVVNMADLITGNSCAKPSFMN